MVSKVFAEELCARMKRLRLRGINVAELTGIGRTQISDYVTGRHLPSEKNIRRIASALEWPIEDAFRAAGIVYQVGEPVSVPGLAEVASMVERLEPGERVALCAHLKDVARSWIASVHLTLNGVLRVISPFFEVPVCPYNILCNVPITSN